MVGYDRIYRTVRDRRYLSSIWDRCEDVKQSPLRCILGHPVYWREGKTPHVYHPNGLDCAAENGAGGMSPAHLLFQNELMEIGKMLGQTCGFEVVGPKRMCRVDVVWQEARIAWEVDLTQQTPRTQRKRAAIREESMGLEMISLVEKLPPRPEVPTIELFHGSGPKYRLKDRFVQNLYGYSLDSSRRLELKSLRGAKFLEIADALVGGELEYRSLAGRKRSAARWGWVLKRECELVCGLRDLQNRKADLDQKLKAARKLLSQVKQKGRSTKEQIGAVSTILTSECLTCEAPPEESMVKRIVKALFDLQKSSQIAKLMASIEALGIQSGGSTEEFEPILQFAQSKLVEPCLFTRLLSREESLFELRGKIVDYRSGLVTASNETSVTEESVAKNLSQLREQIREQKSLIEAAIAELSQPNKRLGDKRVHVG